ncbi:hypothetical protein [Methylomonas sp. MgM2]
MLAVPSSLGLEFEAQLGRRNVPDQQRHEFQKWLWLYPDLCIKYDSNPKLAAREQDLAADAAGVLGRPAQAKFRCCSGK